MKKLLCVLMLGLVFGQTKLETRVYDYYVNINDDDLVLLELNEITNGALNNNSNAIFFLLSTDLRNFFWSMGL